MLDSLLVLELDALLEDAMGVRLDERVFAAIESFDQLYAAYEIAWTTARRGSHEAQS
jgi:acyl carrier protein